MITVEYNGVEKAIDDWGVSNPRRSVLNQGFDHLGFDTGGDFLAADTFAYGTKVTVRTGRAGSGASWTGGLVDFVGYRVDLFRSADPALEKCQYKFESAWGFFFERHTFQQSYKSWNNATHVNETLTRSQIILGQAADGSRQGLAAQIQEIANWVINQTAAEYGAPQFQLGDNQPDGWIPFDAVNNIVCAEALKRCLRWIGGGANSVWIDYNTAPPTLHCKARSDLAAVSLPAVVAPEKIDITRRDDLVPAAVCLKYRVSITDGGLKYCRICEDITSPSGSGYTDVDGAFHGTSNISQLRADALKFGAVVQTFDFEGPTVARVTGKLATTPFAPTSPAFWQTFCPELSQVDPATLAIVPDAGGNLYELDQAPSDSSLIYAVKSGNVAGFMGSPAKVRKLTVSARFSGTVKTDDGRVAHVWNALPKQIQITVTNVAGGTYFGAPDLGEDIPFGLSSKIYNAETPAPYQGTHVITEDEYSGVIGVGNVLNLTGGLDEWVAMRAQVQSLEVDYAAGRTTITVGPATHLGAGDLIDRLRAERGARSVYYIGYNRTNDSNAQVIDLGQPVGNNSTTGHPLPAYQAGFESNDIQAEGQSGFLGMYFFDAPGRAMGVQGTPFVSEQSPGDGSAIIKLADIQTPPSSAGPDPLLDTQARRRAVRLREVPFFDTDGKKYFQFALASEKYSKTSDDGSIGGMSYFPFKLLRSPATPALGYDGSHPTLGADPSLAWRAFRVRAGAVGTVSATGTDGANANPDDPTCNPNANYSDVLIAPSTPIDFVVPDSTATYYVWLDVTSSPAAVKWGATIPGGHTSADWLTGKYILIATIDTLTNHASQKAIVRQYRRADLIGQQISGCDNAGNTFTFIV